MATITTQIPTQAHHWRSALYAAVAVVIVMGLVLTIWTVIDSDSAATSSTEPVSSLSDDQGAPLSEAQQSPLADAREIRAAAAADADRPVEARQSPLADVREIRAAAASVAGIPTALSRN